MKTCPNCSQENPSKARFCTNCWHSLDEEKLPEELLLRKELEEAKSTIKVLKDSLNEAQQHKERAEEYEQTINNMTDEMAEKDRQLYAMSDYINRLKQSLFQSKNKNGNWKWIVTCTVFLIFIIGIFIQKESKEKRQRDQISVYRSELYETRDDLNQMLKVYPFAIQDIDMAFVDKKNNIITDFGMPLYSYKSQYLQPRISYSSTKNQTVNLNIKWFYNGKLHSTQNYSQHVNKGNHLLKLTGWGRNWKGNWHKGKYTIEIWVGDACLKSHSFSIK